MVRKVHHAHTHTSTPTPTPLPPPTLPLRSPPPHPAPRHARTPSHPASEPRVRCGWVATHLLTVRSALRERAGAALSLTHSLALTCSAPPHPLLYQWLQQRPPPPARPRAPQVWTAFCSATNFFQVRQQNPPTCFSISPLRSPRARNKHLPCQRHTFVFVLSSFYPEMNFFTNSATRFAARSAARCFSSATKASSAPTSRSAWYAGGRSSAAQAQKSARKFAADATTKAAPAPTKPVRKIIIWAS